MWRGRLGLLATVAVSASAAPLPLALPLPSPSPAAALPAPAPALEAVGFPLSAVQLAPGSRLAVQRDANTA